MTSDPIERTHHASCWRDRGHHECAVARVETLEALAARMVAWANNAEAPSDRYQYIIRDMRAALTQPVEVKEKS